MCYEPMVLLGISTRAWCIHILWTETKMAHSENIKVKIFTTSKRHLELYFMHPNTVTVV